MFWTWINMKYLNVNNNKEHILKLIDLLYYECLSAGGDGDALWYSKYYDVNDILPLIKEYNDSKKFPWTIMTAADTIYWGDNQEWISITNDKNVYDKSPDWMQ